MVAGPWVRPGGLVLVLRVRVARFGAGRGLLEERDRSWNGVQVYHQALDHHVLGVEGRGQVPGHGGLVGLRLRLVHQDGDLLLDAVGRGPVANILDIIQFGQARDQVIDPEHNIGAGVLGPAPDLVVLFHVGEEEDGDDEGPALELVFDGVADAQGAIHGLAQGVGHLLWPVGVLAEQGAVFHSVVAALHLDGEAGDILGPDDKVDLGAVLGCFDPVEGLTVELGRFNLLVDAEFRLALGVIAVVFRKFRAYTNIVLTSLFIRVWFQVVDRSSRQRCAERKGNGGISDKP